MEVGRIGPSGRAEAAGLSIALSPIGRLAPWACWRFAVAAVAFGITSNTEIRWQLLAAQGRRLQSMVSALEPAFAPFPVLPPSAEMSVGYLRELAEASRLAPETDPVAGAELVHAV